MPFKYGLTLSLVIALLWFAPRAQTAQEKTASVKELRCVFPLNATGVWSKQGSPEAAVKSTRLVLRFDAINTDEGTAELRNGSVGSVITVQAANGNLHFIQSFRSGPLYLTTVFNKDAGGGKLKAVHSRHELFNVPLEGATSSPEQYYGECEPVN
jgi:hypothetical protein